MDDFETVGGTLAIGKCYFSLIPRFDGGVLEISAHEYLVIVSYLYDLMNR